METKPEESPEYRPAVPESWADGDSLHPELLAAKTWVYDPCGFTCSRPVREAESAEYAAHEFTLDGSSVRFRVAKTTPTKVGQFVTVWKRSPGGPIQPFDSGDPVDLFVISTREGHRFGHFIFSRQVLCERGIVSRNGSGGKRAFRIYPPWVETTNRQARTAQAWQVEHFLEIPEDGPLDVARAQALHHP
ncbi:MepB domain containing protein [Streptomyces lydicus]|uniref:MepB domain containing protein n=1 Tax=Streptomyces lydicus TaxID=47763 RepID=A0A3S9YBI6_9ACTN|nr:MepB family protein [Streptomyces lydicus]AZS72351.1 MepB domain containing protein [Streptomyces lydicus]